MTKILEEETQINSQNESDEEESDINDLLNIFTKKSNPKKTKTIKKAQKRSAPKPAKLTDYVLENETQDSSVSKNH